MIAQRIRKRIYGKGRGAVFTPSDFLNLGSRASVDQALSRLADKGTIRRLARGLYDYPKQTNRFGPLTPDPDVIAYALADSADHTLQISPSRAANMFGLTTQVPAKTVYFTDGPTRTKHIGKQTIQFRNASMKTLLGAGQMTGAVFQALRYLGNDAVDDQVITKISGALSDDDKDDLATQSSRAPGWMRPIAQRIAEH
jgi:Family of unknown function (DUF6088)